MILAESASVDGTPNTAGRSGGGSIRGNTVLYEEGPTSWGAMVPDLPGCFAVGRTRAQASHLIRSAIASHIEALRELGEPVPEPHHYAGSVTLPVASRTV